MAETWDRSKQTYFIVRSGDPWQVLSMEGRRFVADFPAFFYDRRLIKAVCFAADDQTVRQILNDAANTSAGC